MENKPINLGFISPVITPDHYVMGDAKIPFVVLKPDGNWGSPLLIEEYQSNLYIETANCTGFNTAKPIEEYMLAAFGLNVNYSARWIGIIAGTRPPGNDPQTVYEAIRKYGLIPEEMLPFDASIRTVDDYYSFKGADRDACYKAGEAWKAEYNFFHDWVFEPGTNLTKETKIAAVKLALTTSPVSFAAYAWAIDNRGVYIRLGPDCHWTSMYAYTDFEKVDDSYMPSQKNVEQEIFFAKRIHIEKALPPIISKSYFLELIEKLVLAFKKAGIIKEITMQEKIYNTASSLLGVSLVPVGDDPDVGCAISVSVLLKEKCGIDIAETQSTYALLEELEKSSSFKEVTDPEPGDVIISATGTQVKNSPIVHGHTGIVAKYGILSNSSLTGLWSENYTLDSWKERYEVQGGFPTRFFRALSLI